jgi:hypothetical protein
METRHDLLELARFLTELTAMDYYFVNHRSSTIALAALLIAMDEISGASKDTANLLLDELEKLSRFQGISEELTACRGRLRLLYAQGGYSRPSVSNNARPETVSPVCVSHGCSPYPLVDASSSMEQSKANYPNEVASSAYRTSDSEQT